MTPFRAPDRALLAEGRLRFAGKELPLETPIEWRQTDPWTNELQGGAAILQLIRLAEEEEDRGPLDLANELVGDWVDQNPIASDPGWNLPVVARRLKFWTAGFATARTALKADEQLVWLQSLYLQGRYLASNFDAIEESEHRLAAIRGLLAVSGLFTGSEPRGWLNLAADRLDGEIASQIFPDGGHICRRPATQLRVLADLLGTLSLLPTGATVRQAVHAKVPLMSAFARAMSGPSGIAAGFGGPSPDDGLTVADVLANDPESRPTPPLQSFPDSAYTTFSFPSQRGHAIVDWIGPRAKPGAGGAAGSLELSFSGMPFIVEPSPETGADERHNSIRVDGRALRDDRFQIGDVLWGEGPGFGYLALELESGTLTHQRRVLAFDSGALVVVDRVRGANDSVESLFHLDPKVRVEEAGERRLFLEREGATVTFSWLRGVEAQTVATTVPTSYGETAASTALRFRLPGGGDRLFALLIAEGRRRDAELDVLENGEERIGVRFDPRRYLLRWEQGTPPRLLLAD